MGILSKIKDAVTGSGRGQVYLEQQDTNHRIGGKPIGKKKGKN